MSEAEFEGLCTEQGLRCVRRVAVADGGAQFLALVEDRAGRRLLLKRNSGLRGHGEIPLLQAWAGTGHVPRDLRPIDPDTFTCEWIDGTTLDASDQPRAELLRRCGAMLRALHEVPVPGSWMAIRERLSASWVDQDLAPFLPAGMAGRAREAARRLAEYDERAAVTLHGDMVPGNVLVEGARVIAIDPIGFRGPAGWDVAQLAIGLAGSDRRANLSALLEGYGREAENVEAAFAYLACVFLAKDLEMERAQPGSRSPVVAELSALMASLG